MRSKLVLIGGVPGSGKTFIGKELSKSIGVFIDKDTVSRFFAEPLLEAYGSNKNDRESDIYITKVRDLEYQTMIKHAFENLEIGNSVICSAPFISEFLNEDWVENIEIEAELFNADIIKVWIHADEKTARNRIIARSADRDNGKLSNWEEYAKKVTHSPPDSLNDLIIIDNTPTSNIALSDQIKHSISLIKK